MGGHIIGAGRLALLANTVWHLEPGTLVEIRCHAGALWVTRPESPRDIVIAAGSVAYLSVGEDTLLSTLGGPAQVSITRQDESRYAA